MKRSQQAGFHVLELSLLLFVLATIGVVGWYVAKAHKPATTVTNTTHQIASSQNTESASDVYMSDITSKLSLKTISMTGKGSQGLAIDPKTGYVYVGAFGGINNACLQGNNQGTSYLDVVDPAQGKQVTATPADFAPIWPAVDDQRGLVYLASSSGVVGIFRLGTGERVGVYRVGGVPHMPAVLGNILVVSNTNDASQDYYSAVNLDSGQVIGAFKGAHLPHPVIVDPDKKIAYMMGVESGDVQVIDMTTGLPQSLFTLEGGAGQLIISKKYNLMITDANKDGDSAAFYDLTSHKMLGTVGFAGLGTPGTGLAVDDADGLLFVILQDRNALAVASLKTMKPLGYFTAGGCPYAVRIDSQRGLGYVTDTGPGALTEFRLSDLKKALGR